MKDPKLTEIRAAGTSERHLGWGRRMDWNGMKAAWVLLGLLALPGCINISAPEEPIVIELNVNIRAEVLYRLAEDASNTIDENADIF